MIKFNTIGQIEHGEYPFEDAIASADTFNGAYGEVTSGSFALSVPVRMTSTLTLLTVSLAAASSALSSTQDGKQQAQPIRSNKCKNVFFID